MAISRVEQCIDSLETGLRTVLDAGRFVVMSEDPAVERGQRHVDAGRPEVGDEHVTGRGPEGELPRRTTTRAGSDRTLRDQPAFDELADTTPDDRPAESGPLDELRPRA